MLIRRLGRVGGSVTTSSGITSGKRMAADLDNLTVTKGYQRWAPVYELVFGAVCEQGRRAAIAAANRVGGRILEVGVGTGISLPKYASDNRIVGSCPWWWCRSAGSLQVSGRSG